MRARLHNTFSDIIIPFPFSSVSWPPVNARLFYRLGTLLLVPVLRRSGATATVLIQRYRPGHWHCHFSLMPRFVPALELHLAVYLRNDGACGGCSRLVEYDAILYTLTFFAVGPPPAMAPDAGEAQNYRCLLDASPFTVTSSPS